MNEAILVELHFFGTSVFWGMLLLIFYDLLRILRRLVIHNSFLVALEDLNYWVISSVLIFRMMYLQNNGIIRGFSILAMLIGMFIYRGLISDRFVDMVAGTILKVIEIIHKIILFLTRPIWFLLRWFKRLLIKNWNIVKKFTIFLLRPLKNRWKSSKIKISDNEKGD